MYLVVLGDGGREMRYSVLLHVTDGCSREVEQLVVDNEMRGNLQWEEVAIGEVAKLECPCEQVSVLRQATRACMGDFASGGRWMNADTSACEFNSLAWQLCSNAVCNIV